jgi:hypothetical protein
MKILSLCGLLGYGYEEASLKYALETGIDVIGVDAGSVDPGPHYLGSGTSFTNYDAVKRDLALALPEAIRRKIPFIIGTAGGSGSKVHLAWCKKIIEEIAVEHDLHFTMGIIETDVDAEYVKEKIRQGKTRELGHGLELTEQNVDKCTHIVSQIGAEPFIRMIDKGADLILAGRACDTAIYTAPALKAGCDEGLALHMAKIMECGALCAEPMTASDAMIAEIGKDSFTLEPANFSRRCTIARVAAHTMYEQSNPYFIYEPNGMADLRLSRYEQINERVVRVSNSLFKPTEKYTLKIEGSMLAGYRTICIAKIHDPATIARLDELMDKVRVFIKTTLKDTVDPDAYTVTLRRFGDPLPGIKDPGPYTNTLGIIIDVVARTQDMANTICALARARLLHTDYPGRKSSAGNLAFPFSPSDIPVGPVYVFGIYHLVEADDPFETSKMSLVKVGA